MPYFCLTKRYKSKKNIPSPSEQLFGMSTWVANFVSFHEIKMFLYIKHLLEVPLLCRQSFHLIPTFISFSVKLIK